MIYFIQAGDDGPIKIGFTDDVRRRIGELQTTSPERLFIRKVMPGNLTFERNLHARFAEHHLQGEWFNPAPEILHMIGLQPVPAQQSAQQYKGPWFLSRVFALLATMILAELFIVPNYPAISTMLHIATWLYILFFIEIALVMACKLDKALARWVPLS